MRVLHRVTRLMGGFLGDEASFNDRLGDASDGDYIRMPNGLYCLNGPIIWPQGLDNATLDLNGSVLKIAVSEAATTVSGNHAPGVTDVTLADASDFSVGDWILLGINQYSDLRQIGNIVGNVVTLTLATNFTQNNSYPVRRQFPAISVGYHAWAGTATVITEGAAIKNGTIRWDVPTTEQSFWVGGLSFIRSRGHSADNIKIYNSPAEGITDQTYLGAANPVNASYANIHTEGCNARGIHVGSGWLNGSITNATIKDCTIAGIYLCDNCNNGVYTDIEISGCGMGIEGMAGSNGSASDSNNTFTRVNIHDNVGVGVDGVHAAFIATGNRFEHCQIWNNGGHGFELEYQDSFELFNCLIFDNTGAAVSIDANSTTAIDVESCSISKNDAGGVISANLGITNVKDCIIRGNGVAEVTAGCNVTYSNIEGGYAGTGNINSNPGWTTGPTGWAYYMPGGNNSEDAGSALASALGLDEMTTRTDDALDGDTVDMGCHFTPVTSRGVRSLQFTNSANSMYLGGV